MEQIRLEDDGLIGLLLILLFLVIFGAVQSVMYLKYDTTPTKEAIKQISKMKNSSVVQNFIAEKQIQLRKMGAAVLLKDQMTVSQWYMYKGLMAGLFFAICMFIAKGIFDAKAAVPLSLVALVIGWFFLDIVLRALNKSSNEEMMDDIMEMSRSVLYGKRGGQYIADALKDSVMVVENKRLKTALIQLGNDLDSGRSLDDCLQELEMSFSNGEITSFCTVIKSLQSTGQVDEALRTLENNIEREQVSVNKRRCVVLEQKTTLYVILIAMDILGMLLYCIIMKLMDMQLGI